MTETVQALTVAVDQLAAVDLAGEDDRELLDQVVALQRLADRLAAQQLRVLAEVDARGAYGVDRAATTAPWYRGRTRLDHGHAARLVQAATRLRKLPVLRTAFQTGEVTSRHVRAVTDAAVPGRMAAISEAEETLVDLARSARHGM